MMGLTKSLASRSQSSLFQFFQAPFFHLSMSIPCSLSLFLMSSGILILSSPLWDADAPAWPLALLLPESQAVAVSASAAVRPTAASTGRFCGARSSLDERRRAGVWIAWCNSPWT